MTIPEPFVRRGFINDRSGVVVTHPVNSTCDPAKLINRPVVICVLGDFRVLKQGEALSLRAHSKIETLLCTLATHSTHAVPRDTLIELLWPSSEPALASQSLHSLVYSLHKLLGDAIANGTPIMHWDGSYHLNPEIAVDIAWFERIATDGLRQAQSGNIAAAIRSFDHAVELYRGDLCWNADVQSLIRRERLRALYLTALIHLAQHHFDNEEYEASLTYAQLLLLLDSCREDAHRFVMRCHTRRGERAQALRQYQLCEHILRSEFDAPPEPATIALYERIRLDPDGV